MNHYSTILRLALAMLMAIIMANGVVIYLKIDSGVVLGLSYDNPLILVGIIVGSASIPAGIFMYKMLASKARQLSIDEDKLSSIKTAVIMRQAIWEGGIIVNLYAFWTSNSWIPLIVAGGIIFMFLISIPTQTKIKNDLEIG